MGVTPMNDPRPLIWTTKGNLPIQDLRYVTRWEQSDDYVKFVETYFLGDEVVKESCHVMMKNGASAIGQQGAFK